MGGIIIFKKATSVFCLITLLFSFFLTSCNKQDTSSQELEEIPKKEELANQEEPSIKNIAKVLYDSNDSLNPYALSTELNSKIVPLIFDGLVCLDESFEPLYLLAKDISRAQNIIEVSISDKAFFSDGSRVTADDVIYSFNLAKSPQYWNSFDLSKLLYATKKDDNTVLFEAEGLNPNYKSLFTFPIVKIIDDSPIGSGRYVLSRENEELVLVPSGNVRYKDCEYNIQKIELIKNNPKASDSFRINMGEIDFSYGKIESTKTMTAPYVFVPTNRLIYLGINHSNEFLSNQKARRAIAGAFDMSKIRAFVSLRGNDYKNSFLNPHFFRSSSFEQNLISSKAIIDSLGYKSEKSGEIRKTPSNAELKLRLLVNSENLERNLMAEEIKRQLLDVGINIELVSLPFNEYLNNLRAGNFDLYIAEYGVSSDMDLMPLLTRADSSGFGQLEESSSKASAEQYKNGKIDEAKLNEALLNDVPFIPIAYREDLLYCNENFAPYIVATNGDIFYNIVSFSFK